MFQFISPPLPHYIISGEDTYAIGRAHPNRANIGVFDLIVVTRGCLYLEEEHKSYQVSAGHYLILRPDRSHRTIKPCIEETHFYWLHFQTLGLWNEGNEQLPASPTEPNNSYMQVDYFSFYLRRTKKLQAPEAIFEQLRLILVLQKHTLAAARWKQQQLFHDLLLELQVKGSVLLDSPHLVIAEEAAAFFRQHYKEPLSYKQLAESLHFHPNYIALCMKRTFGCTPLEYLTRHRVERSKQLLIHTNDPIGQIAIETGFGSFPYFIRCFSRHTGVKPKAFRMQFRSK